SVIIKFLNASSKNLTVIRNIIVCTLQFEISTHCEDIAERIMAEQKLTKEDMIEQIRGKLVNLRREIDDVKMNQKILKVILGSARENLDDTKKMVENKKANPAFGKAAGGDLEEQNVGGGSASDISLQPKRFRESLFLQRFHM
ncbi:hypothetical protein L9F63_024789, partial [Diploptera punctata]